MLRGLTGLFQKFIARLKTFLTRINAEEKKGTRVAR